MKNMQQKKNGRTRQPKSRLRFSPAAWAKLLYLRDVGETEVGGFGVSAADDLLYVEDVQLVLQTCTAVSVAFDDTAVADFFDQQVDRGFSPRQFGRIWIHTHPGSCPLPSGVDEETFQRVFCRPDWAVMFILAQGGQTYTRLRFNTGPGGSFRIPIEVAFDRPFHASDFSAWQQEYLDNVRPETWPWRKVDAILAGNSAQSLNLTGGFPEEGWLYDF